MSDYGTVEEVAAFTKHVFAGQPGFSDETKPTITEVRKFLDRACGVMNLALANAGLKTPVTQATAKLAIDDWVVTRVAEYVEVTLRGSGYNEQDGNRGGMFRNMSGAAKTFVEENRLGFINLGVPVSFELSRGLINTALIAQDERTDQNDDQIEQPIFVRRLFDTDENEGE
jgi:hypothetical protein